MRTSKKEILLFLFCSWVKLTTEYMEVKNGNESDSIKEIEIQSNTKMMNLL